MRDGGGGSDGGGGGGHGVATEARATATAATAMVPWTPFVDACRQAKQKYNHACQIRDGTDREEAGART